MAETVELVALQAQIDNLQRDRDVIAQAIAQIGAVVGALVTKSGAMPGLRISAEPLHKALTAVGQFPPPEDEG